MANYRQIQVNIWKDEWFIELNPDEKLLFIYLFSNELASLCGLYKIPLRVIANETGLDMKFIAAAMDRFSQAGKVYYENGLVWVVNLRKHNRGSIKTQIRIDNDIKEIPDCPLKAKYIEYFSQNIPYQYPMDRVSADGRLTLIKLNESIEEEGEQPPDEFTQMVNLATTLIGLPAVNGDVKTINKWIADGVTEADIRAALQWRVDNEKPPLKSISQLAGGVETNRTMRIQAASAKPGANHKKSTAEKNTEVLKRYAERSGINIDGL